MEIKRRKFQGVWNILSFNRHFYVIGILVLTTLLGGLLLLQVPIVWIWIVFGTFLYGLLMPLIVSAYVYDYSGYYNFDWVDSLHLSTMNPKKIANINAGFDETSFILKNKFPAAELKVFDFYNAKQHTEPAIVRARKVSITYPNTLQIPTHKIPLKEGAMDMIFLLSAANEIRSHQEKVLFLKECFRISKHNTKVIMVEHLRDVPNFFAFSIGVTHFFSKKTWKKAFDEAGFSTFEETKFTPFMSIFICCP